MTWGQPEAEEGLTEADRSSHAPSAQDKGEVAGAVSKQSSISADLPELSPRVIRTGKLSLELEKGTYQEKRGEVYFLVESAGGYVQSENTGGDGGSVRGTFLLRIPADRFDRVFPDLSRLGEVKSTEVATQDVTQEYIDLEGRIRHLEAEEQFYLGLIAQAKTIQEMLSIRERLDSVQLQKEQALGRKNYLDKQISYSLVTLNMSEAPPGDSTGKGFWGRIGEAFRSFGRACRELLVGLAYALPYLALLIIAAMLAWAAVRRRRVRKAPGPESRDGQTPLQ